MSAPHLTPMPLYQLGFRGYTRAGVEVVLPPVCPVPGSIFTMGSDKTQDQQAIDEETPQYPTPVESFSIGQHPVTVAEYVCAVRAKVVREPPEVDETGWQRQLQHLDHPVDCVSWYDALAYAAWLAKTTGQLWHLPSEAEWEKAARWDPEHQVSRIFPWGNDFDKTRCNTREGGKGEITPVGSYVSGASPCGAQDMVGNVSEWTSSQYMPYPYRPDDPSFPENRVLRGGTWDSDTRRARAAFRYLVRPDDFFVGCGFRLALATTGS